MSNLIDSAQSALFQDGEILILMRGGQEIRFPADANPRLARGAPEQLNNMELSPFGIHWPELDEDLSFQRLLSGDHGQADQGGGSNA